jgi:hypothetical protein
MAETKRLAEAAAQLRYDFGPAGPKLMRWNGPSQMASSANVVVLKRHKEEGPFHGKDYHSRARSG